MGEAVAVALLSGYLVDFLAVVFFAAVFFAGVLVAVLVDAFFATVFFAGVFVSAVFLAAAFFAGTAAFFVAKDLPRWLDWAVLLLTALPPRFVTGRFVADFDAPAADFLPADFLEGADFFAAAFFAGGKGAFLAAFLTADGAFLAAYFAAGGGVFFAAFFGAGFFADVNLVAGLRGADTPGSRSGEASEVMLLSASPTEISAALCSGSDAS